MGVHTVTSQSSLHTLKFFLVQCSLVTFSIFLRIFELSLILRQLCGLGLEFTGLGGLGVSNAWRQIQILGHDWVETTEIDVSSLLTCRIPTKAMRPWKLSQNYLSDSLTLPRQYVGPWQHTTVIAMRFTTLRRFHVNRFSWHKLFRDVRLALPTVPKLWMKEESQSSGRLFLQSLNWVSM